MITYIALFLLGIFILYKVSNSFSNALVGAFSGGMTSGRQQTDIQDLFFRTVFTLLGYVAKRDGAINQREVKRTEVYMEKMELDAAHKREAIRLFTLGAQPEFRVEKTIEGFKWLAKESPNLVQILLVYLINLARVDGLLVSKEIEAVQKVALGLGYTDLAFNHLLKMVSAQNTFSDATPSAKANQPHMSKPHPREEQKVSSSKEQKNHPKTKTCEEQTEDFAKRPDQLENAYAVFNLPMDATDAQIKKSYRAMVNQFHPDKLVSLGLPPYMIHSATDCFQKIQAAYDYIKNARK